MARISPRQRLLVKGVLEGKPVVQAAQEAGYAKSTAYSKGHLILDRPIVRSFLTEAYERAGITPEKIIQPVLDGLKARKDDKADHDTRLKSYKFVTDAYGVVPRQTEMPDPPAPPVNITFTERPRWPVVVNPKGEKETPVDMGPQVNIIFAERKTP